MAETTHTLKIKTILDTAQVKAQLAGIQSSVGGIGAGPSAQLKIDQAINKLTATLNQLPSKVASASEKSVDISSRKLMRLGVTLGLGRVAGSAATYAENSGYGKAARLTRGLSEIGMAGALGAQAGGPIGLPVGIIFGSLDVIFKTLGENAKAASEALAKLKPAIDAQITAESEYLNKKNRGDFIEGAVERNDIGSLQSAIKHEKWLSSSARAKINEMDANGGIKSEAQLNQRKEWLDQMQKSDQIIAQYEQAISEIERNLERTAAEELRAFETAKKEAEDRAKYEAELNKTINDQIAAYERGEETEATKKLLDTGDFGAIATKLKEQSTLAADQKSAYKYFIDQANIASTTGSKEFFLGQAEQAQENWKQAQTQVDLLGGGLTSDLQSILGSLVSQKTPVSGLAAIGLGMGENDTGYQQSINERVGKVIDTLNSILDEMKSGDSSKIVLQ